MLNRRDMQRTIFRMLKGKVSSEPEIRERQFASFTGAYNCFSSVSSQYIGKTVTIGGHKFSNAADDSPRSCEIYDLRIGLVVHADGWIDGYIIARTDCLYMTQDEICNSEKGTSSLEVAIGVASMVTFTALDGKDSFEMKLVYPKICKTNPCKAVDCISINLAGKSTIDDTPNPHIKNNVSAVVDVRYVDPRYDLSNDIFARFFLAAVENGTDGPGEFTDSDLFGQVLVDSSGIPVSAIVYASDKTIRFDASTLALCIGTTSSFTVIAHDTGIVEVQFEHDIEQNDDGEYEMVLYGEECDSGINHNIEMQELTERFKGDISNDEE